MSHFPRYPKHFCSFQILCEFIFFIDFKLFQHEIYSYKVMFFISCLKAERSCFHSSLLYKPENKGFCELPSKNCFIYAYYVHHTITTPLPPFVMSLYLSFVKQLSFSLTYIFFKKPWISIYLDLRFCPIWTQIMRSLTSIKSF